jgi:hypothetical protein
VHPSSHARLVDDARRITVCTRAPNWNPQTCCVCSSKVTTDRWLLAGRWPRCPTQCTPAGSVDAPLVPNTAASNQQSVSGRRYLHSSLEIATVVMPIGWLQRLHDPAAHHPATPASSDRSSQQLFHEPLVHAVCCMSRDSTQDTTKLPHLLPATATTTKRKAFQN